MVEEVYTQRELPEKDKRGPWHGNRMAKSAELATHIRKFPKPTSGKPMPEVLSV